MTPLLQASWVRQILPVFGSVLVAGLLSEALPVGGLGLGVGIAFAAGRIFQHNEDHRTP